MAAGDRVMIRSRVVRNEIADGSHGYIPIEDGKIVER
jgi:hypothetical protein